MRQSKYWSPYKLFEYTSFFDSLTPLLGLFARKLEVLPRPLTRIKPQISGHKHLFLQALMLQQPLSLCLVLPFQNINKLVTKYSIVKQTKRLKQHRRCWAPQLSQSIKIGSFLWITCFWSTFSVNMWCWASVVSLRVLHKFGVTMHILIGIYHTSFSPILLRHMKMKWVFCGFGVGPWAALISMQCKHRVATKIDFIWRPKNIVTRKVLPTIGIVIVLHPKKKKKSSTLLLNSKHLILYIPYENKWIKYSPLQTFLAGNKDT